MAYGENLSIDDRALVFAEFILEHKATVRAVASRFGYSKSTVHKDLTTRLKNTNAIVYGQVAELLQENKQTRHIRGGNATKYKYAEIKKTDDKLKTG